MNDVKINKNEKIHFLEFLKEATTLYDIVFLAIFVYITTKMEDVPYIAFNIIVFFFIFFNITINFALY